MPKNKIEAVLFTIGKFMSSEEISKLAGVHIDKVEELLNNLKKEYEERGSSLIILNDNSKWKLSIKKEYMHLTEKLLTDTGCLLLYFHKVQAYTDNYKKYDAEINRDDFKVINQECSLLYPWVQVKNGGFYYRRHSF